ncbi:hypothetical protein [Sporosalibacterium faouarense]|uniref:hypothetical protein n=1 Tax=Sporosalibacterium faouarense TaxID=516123 RepID=UPI00141C5E3E|nr:hypothetical protein [Sporosalibacterium faouarense]MTI47926.1 hypothetical protein [Bacillota bacterium]
MDFHDFNSFSEYKISVIIDTPCYYQEIIDHGIRIAKKFNINYKYIECRVEEYSIIKNRIYSRDRLISQIDSTSLERFNQAVDKSIKPEDSNYLIIDTSSKNSYDMNSIEEYLIGD